MFRFTLLTLLLRGLMVVNSKNLQSTNVSVKHVNSIQNMAHNNETGAMDIGRMARKPDRCGPVAFRCYEPILSYIDINGESCGWKNMTSFWTLPNICMSINSFSVMNWGDNVVKNTYIFLKTCDKTSTFQQCVHKNQVCRRDNAMDFIMSQQTTFCDNIQAYLSATTCVNAWDNSDNWWKLVYTYDVIVQACPVIHYRKLALNSIKLFLFNYITYPSAWTDGAIESVNAEAAGRSICQIMQQNLCFLKRGDKLCTGYLPLLASQNYYDKALINFCNIQTPNAGKCNEFMNMNCPINLTSGHMKVKMDLSDLRNVYNKTYWHAVGNSEVAIWLHIVNKDISHCDARNLIFKQIGCFHQYMTQIDMHHANHADYLSKYMCSKIKIYNS